MDEALKKLLMNAGVPAHCVIPHEKFEIFIKRWNAIHNTFKTELRQLIADAGKTDDGEDRIRIKMVSDDVARGMYFEFNTEGL